MHDTILVTSCEPVIFAGFSSFLHYNWLRGLSVAEAPLKAIYNGAY